VSGLQGMMKGLPADATSGMQDIPTWGVLVFNLLGVMFNIIFGALGAWLGVTIFNRSRKSELA
jgi:hypothetical protein